QQVGGDFQGRAVEPGAVDDERPGDRLIRSGQGPDHEAGATSRSAMSSGSSGVRITANSGSSAARKKSTRTDSFMACQKLWSSPALAVAASRAVVKKAS